jgi:thiol-disulfide isomerase/thioredoxin
MKISEKSTCLILIIVLITSCYQKHNIEAKIKGLGNDTVLVEYVPISKFYEMEEPLLDTIITENGKFSYDTPSNEPILVFMFPKKGEYKRLDGVMYRPMQKYIVTLLKKEDKIKIQGELQGLYLDYQAKGSEFNENYSQVRHKYISKASGSVLIELKLDTLLFKNEDQALISELFKQRTEIGAAEKIEQLEYIKNNWDKELSAYYLTRQPLDTLGKYFENLSSDLKEGIFRNMLENRIITFKKFVKVREAELNIKVGGTAPDFTLKSIDGNNFTLSSIQKEYIVLDFWGSWCGPCVSGFPKMKEYHNKYKSQIEFVGIACKDQKEKWENYVKENELDWIQLINNDDIDFDVSVMYSVKGYPTKLILDKDLQILDIFNGEGSDFYSSLDKLITKN